MPVAKKGRTVAEVVADQNRTAKPATALPVGAGVDPLNEVEKYAIAQAESKDTTVIFEHLRENNAAREVTYLRVLRTVEDLRATYGRETLADWPEPESTKATTNRLPDKFSVQHYDAEKRKSIPINKTFFGCYVDASDDGKVLTAEIEAVKAGTNHYANWPDSDRKLEASRLKQQRDAMVKTVREAIQVERQCSAIEELLAGKVSYKFARKIDDNGKETAELRPTKEGILMWDDASPENKEKFTVTTFLDFDIAAAAKKQGTMAAVRTSRKPKAPSTKGGADTGGIKLPTVTAFQTWCNQTATQLQNDTFLTQLQNYINSDNGDAMVTAMGDIFVAMTPYFYNIGETKLPPMNGMAGKRYQLLRRGPKNETGVRVGVNKDAVKAQLKALEEAKVAAK